MFQLMPLVLEARQIDSRSAGGGGEIKGCRGYAKLRWSYAEVFGNEGIGYLIVSRAADAVDELVDQEQAEIER